MDFLSRRRRRRILRRWRANWIRGLFLFKLLFLRRWLRRNVSVRIIGDTISSIPCLTRWTCFWSRTRWILEEFTRIPAGSLGFLTWLLSIRSKRYNCIHFSHRLARFNRRRWGITFKVYLKLTWKSTWLSKRWCYLGKLFNHHYHHSLYIITNHSLHIAINSPINFINVSIARRRLHLSYRRWRSRCIRHT